MFEDVNKIPSSNENELQAPSQPNVVKDENSKITDRERLPIHSLHYAQTRHQKLQS